MKRIGGDRVHGVTMCLKERVSGDNEGNVSLDDEGNVILVVQMR